MPRAGIMFRLTRAVIPDQAIPFSAQRGRHAERVPIDDLAIVIPLVVDVPPLDLTLEQQVPEDAVLGSSPGQHGEEPALALMDIGHVLNGIKFSVDVHTPKANVQYTTLDRKPLKSVRNRHQTNTILNTSHEPKSTTVLELKYRSYEMFTIIQEFTEKYRGFRGSLFSIHPLSGCERLLGIGDVAVAMVLHQARGAMDLGGGKIGRTVQRHQVVAVQIDETFERLAALQATEDLAERGPQARGIDRIENGPHLGVGGDAADPVDGAKVVVGVAAAVVKGQQGWVLEREHREG